MVTRAHITILGGIASLGLIIFIAVRDWKIAFVLTIACVYAAAFFQTQIQKKKIDTISALDSMSAPIPSRVSQTVNEIETLKRLNKELDSGAKLLIRRDLELTKANEKLLRLDQMKSEFVSLVTHQLRTPLSGVKWSISMLLNGEMGELSPEQKTYLLKTYESNERMISLINDMLQADRLESGMMQFTFRPTQLLDLIDNVLIELNSLAYQKQVKLMYGKREEVPQISIDPQNMRLVLQNLIENAIKYTPPSGTVTIHVSKNDPFVEVTVADTGIGIPLSHQKNIFQRFFRAPNAVLTETSGSGLGLYIVHSIIERHGGSISFTSTEGKGSIFTIRLPLHIS